MDLRQLTLYEHFGCVNICAHTFSVCGPRFTMSRRKLWWRYSHYSPDVIEAHTLNFKPNFKFSRLKVFGRPPSPLGDGLGSLGQSVTSVKIWDGSTAKLPKCRLPKNVHLGWSLWAIRTFLFVDQSSPIFFCRTWKGLWLIKFFSDVRYVDQFRRYSRWNSKVVRNCAEIWTFFWPSVILGADLPKVVHALSSLPHGTSSGKFSWGYSH